MFVGREKAQARFDVCKKCLNYKKTGQCGICHCFMRIKVRMENEECPIGYW